MVRQVVSNPAISELAREGARAILSIHRTSSRPMGYDLNGSLLYACGARVESLAREAGMGRADGLEIQEWSPAEAARRIPLLEGAAYETGWFCPSDGVVDIAALLDHYILGAREAGAQVIPGAEAAEAIVEGGRVAGVRAGDVTVRAPTVVNAAGAWAGPFARHSGALPIPIRVLRRHLVYTGPFPNISRSWPFVWDVSNELYFRPEAAGLLLSPCDEAEVEAGIPEMDPSALALLVEKVSRHLPALGNFPVERSWAGVRMFSPDSSFIIGPDPVLPGFFWASALGGHGVTTSFAVGALAADLVERPGLDAENRFSPGRFQVGVGRGQGGQDK